MRLNRLLMFFLLLSLLIGCSKERTFEEFFHKEMEAKQEGYDKDVLNSYSLVHHEQNVVQKEDAIAIRRENNIQGEQIFITYFKKENGTWYWEQTRGAEWDTPHKWSAMNELPHIYSGAISDNNITEIYAGEEQAKIIDVEGNKRYWYAVSPFKDVEVKYVRKDGTEEIIESIDYEMLEELAK